MKFFDYEEFESLYKVEVKPSVTRKGLKQRDLIKKANALARKNARQEKYARRTY